MLYISAKFNAKLNRIWKIPKRQILSQNSENIILASICILFLANANKFNLEIC